MRKIAVVFVVIGFIILSAFIYLHYSISTPGFTPAQAEDSVTNTKPSQSFLDLKPKLTEKLQQLVKQGSNGLYNLFIHEMNPDILNSTIGISNASLVPDTAVMRQLEQTNLLPNEIFKIQTDSIWIDGLGVKDILSKDVIDVQAIHILSPTIEVYSKKKGGNKTDSKTLYQRLMNQMKHIGIGKVVIHNGTLISHSIHKNKPTRLNDIYAKLTNIKIDSTTQFDKSRFLYAKDAEITTENYSIPTSNHLYTLKIGLITITATQQLLVAKNIVLQPHYGKQEFQHHIAAQKERYSVSIPSMEFRNMDWWNLINNETLQAKSVQINKADVSVYLDRRKALGAMNLRGFPHQLIMNLPLKINIEKLKVNELDIVYEEHSNLSGQTGKVHADNLRGTISNLTNLPDAVRRNKITRVSASGNFMKVVPVSLNLVFDLTKYKTGAFSAQLKTKSEFDGRSINSVAQPLGMFMVKRGQLKELTSQVNGNNHQASGKTVLLYNDLHITPMKQDPQRPGKLKKKSVTSFVANKFVLKDENPSKDGTIREVDASFTRQYGTFFNLIWKTTFVGILKTIGAPEKMAYQ
jgi:hypothetical protein